MSDEEARRLRHERSFEIFDRASGLGADEQASLLDEACADDAELRALVAELLETSEGTEDFLEPRPETGGLGRIAAQALSAARIEEAADLALPERVGGYRIVGLLGRGGMGVVYEAEQEQPRRRVALKVLGSSLGSREVVARFRQEAELLGRLQHPGIAQVFDAGTDATLGLAGGQPYFVMELVDGEPITKYSRRKDLDTRRCLELIALTCDAVAHANAQGIVHRDLKPANILVTQEGRPKVLDFGVARSAGDEALSTLHTSTGQLLGTLPYMSPEQAGGRQVDVDEQVDVYALGVIAYEMLTGRLPHDMQELSLGEALDVIRHDSAPSLKLHDARHRGDVETLVGTALEKDRERRYRGVADFAADIRRYLEHEPIRARPASLRYRAAKLVHRHPALTTLGALLVLALAIGSTVAVSLTRRANLQEELTRRETLRLDLHAAAAALEAHDAALTRRLLEGVALERRGWEWRHLHARLDASDRALPGVVVDRAYPILATSGGSFVLVEKADDGIPPTTLVTWEAGSNAPPARRTLSTDGIIEVEQEAVPLALMLSRERFPAREAELTLRDSATGLLTTLRRCDKPRGTDRSGVEQVILSRQLSPREVLSFGETESGRQVLYCDWTTGRELLRFDVLGRPLSWALGAAGELAVGTSTGGRISVHDLQAGRMLARWTAHPNEVTGLSFPAGQDRLVSSSIDGTVKAWAPRTGELLAEQRALGGAAYAVAASPRGDWVAVGGDDHAVHVFSGDLTKEVSVLHGHAAGVRALAFGRDGRLVSVDKSGAVLAWDAPAEDPWVSPGLGSWTTAVAYSPDGRLLASTEGDGSLSLWDAASGTRLAGWATPGGSWCNLSFDGQGRRIALVQSRDLIVLDTWTGRSSARQMTPDPIDPPSALRWLPDDLLLVATRGSLLKVDALTLDVVDRRARPEGRTALAPDGRRLAIASAENFVLWSVETGTEVARSSEPLVEPKRLAWSPDGRWVAGVGADERVRVWSGETGQPVAALPHGREDCLAAAFLPDSSRLLTAGRDGRLRVWSTPEFDELAVLTEHSDYIIDIAVSPDGESVVTGSGDATLRTWSTRPARMRRAARRAREALVERAEPLVAARLAGGVPLAQLSESLGRDEGLEPELRRVALQLAIARVAAERAGGE